MKKNRTRTERQKLWQGALVLGIIIELLFVAGAVQAMLSERHSISAWQQIAFVAILVWIYIAYLKQRAKDISAHIIDEKIKTHALVQYLSEGIVLLAPNDTILLMNDRAAEWLGLDALESLGKPFLPSADATVASMLGNRESGECEATAPLTHKKARVRIVRLDAKNHDEQHKLLCITPAEEAPSEADEAPESAANENTDLAALLETIPPISADTPADWMQWWLHARALQQARQAAPLATLAKNELANQLNRESLPLSDCLSPLLETYNTAFSALQVSVDTSKVKMETAIRVDPQSIGLALEGLLLTALAGITQPGTSLTVQTAVMGRHIGLSFLDTGETVNKDDINQLYQQPYAGVTQADGTILRKASPGLAATRLIIEAHGGTLWVESPPDGGLRTAAMLPCK